MHALRSVRAAWQRLPSWQLYTAATTSVTGQLESLHPHIPTAPALLALHSLRSSPCPPAVALLASSVSAQKRKAAQRAVSREFPPNSATEQISQALDTGDVLIFNRRVWDGRVCALFPPPPHLTPSALRALTTAV